MAISTDPRIKRLWHSDRRGLSLDVDWDPDGSISRRVSNERVLACFGRDIQEMKHAFKHPFRDNIIVESDNGLATIITDHMDATLRKEVWSLSSALKLPRNGRLSIPDTPKDEDGIQAYFEELARIQAIPLKIRDILRFAISSTCENLSDKHIVLAWPNSQTIIDYLLPVLIENSRSSWVLLGGTRLSGRIGEHQEERPYLDFQRAIDASSRYLDAGKYEIYATLSDWAKTRGIEAERGLTATEVVEFTAARLLATPRDDVSVPQQIPSPLRVGIEDGALTFVEEELKGPLGDVATNILSEILELCRDVQSSAYMSNFAPGADRKLQRLVGYIQTVESHGADKGRIIQIGIVNNALKDIVEREKEEFPGHAISEMSVLFSQLDLFLAQFDDWQDYVASASRSGWGLSPSLEFVNAVRSTLGEVYASDDTADQQLRERARELEIPLAAGDATKDEMIGAISATHNILAKLAGYVWHSARVALKEIAGKWTRTNVQWTSDKLLQLFLNLASRFEALVQGNPNLFLWLKPIVDLFNNKNEM